MFRQAEPALEVGERVLKFFGDIYDIEREVQELQPDERRRILTAALFEEAPSNENGANTLDLVNRSVPFASPCPHTMPAQASKKRLLWS